MRLIESGNNDCVAAAMSMVLGRFKIDGVQGDLFTDLMKPFHAPFHELPKVPDTTIICEYMLDRGFAMVPFEHNPMCSPHPECSPVPAYPRNKNPHNHDNNPDKVWDRQLHRGPGLLEGRVGENGHMVAWNGEAVYDPRGFIYSLNVADKFDFEPMCFWLAVKVAE